MNLNYKTIIKNTKRIATKYLPSRQKEILKKYFSKAGLRLNPNSPFQKSKLDLLNNGFSESIKIGHYDYVPSKKTVLYLLHHSLPYNGSGYSVRSHEILSALKHSNCNVYGVTRLGFPWDLMSKTSATVLEKEYVDNVEYLRLPSDSKGLRQIPLRDYMEAYLDAVLSLAKDYKPSIIHAASNYIDGNVGVKAAQILGIPSIYEARGLWEITRISRQPWWENSDEFAMCERLETEACLNASMVISITPALKKYLIQNRGIEENKIKVIPNGVNATRFMPISRDHEMECRYGLTEKTVIGFVGSINEYEGLEHLFYAAKLLFRYRDDFRILIVGDGRYYDKLKIVCSKLKIDDKVIFTGRVPYDQVERFYSLIDIAPFPRKGSLVCELVSPLKPFEAMAMAKCVVVSNVEALADIIEDGKTGLVFEKDNRNDLTKVLKNLLDNPVRREYLAANGRTWVLSNRDWAQLGGKVQELYMDLINNNNK